MTDLITDDDPEAGFDYTWTDGGETPTMTCCRNGCASGFGEAFVRRTDIQSCPKCGEWLTHICDVPTCDTCRDLPKP